MLLLRAEMSVFSCLYTVMGIYVDISIYMKRLYYVFMNVSSNVLLMWNTVLYYYRFNYNVILGLCKILQYFRNVNLYLRK